VSDITPTRAALLELRDESHSMREGYEFLDEKRLLLAAEMLRELRQYETAWSKFEMTLHAAAARLRAAVARHGLQGVQVYPAATLENVELQSGMQRLLGVRLLEAQLAFEPSFPEQTMRPSAEAEQCRRAYLAILAEAAPLAALAGNLERLRHEYRRTERRARALEDVLLPEVNANLHEIEARLEETEQEEAIRVRLV
jgi:V/A-type H+-transporting ATPase subunit D